MGGGVRLTDGDGGDVGEAGGVAGDGSGGLLQAPAPTTSAETVAATAANLAVPERTRHKGCDFDTDSMLPLD
ncbi:hypothetical protein D7003_10110 [Arthrobacter oryzae]|uniref:Uncharacterized protein n=1 Tax=Arthrobacter oryzae TaxID=409290 RepID=A0A3N0BZ95_9MICC|nr:hypothetical protein D7003_10110 [Arthrobacter oryzae]